MTDVKQNQQPFSAAVEPVDGNVIVLDVKRGGRGQWDPEAAYTVKPSADAIAGYQYLAPPARLWDPAELWGDGGQVFIDTVRQAACIIQPYQVDEGPEYGWSGVTWPVRLPATVDGEEEFSYLLYTRIGQLMGWQPTSTIGGAYGIVVALTNIEGNADGAFLHVGFKTDLEAGSETPLLCISKWGDSVTLLSETLFPVPTHEGLLCVQINVVQEAESASIVAVQCWVCDDSGMGKRLVDAAEFVEGLDPGPLAVMYVGFAATGYLAEAARTSENAYCEFIRIEGPYSEEQLDTNPIDNPRCPLLRTTGGRNWPGG